MAASRVLPGKQGRPRRVLAAAALALGVLLDGPAFAQSPTTQPQPAVAAEMQKDALGRDTPRGTLLGFMAAARKDNFAAAALYLRTPLRDDAAAAAARRLFVVLDARLPARLQDVSDLPAGSIPDPLQPDRDVIGTIATGGGPVAIVVERVRVDTGQVWLFSRQTLDAIQPVYDEVHLVTADRYLPTMLTRPSIAGIRLFNWLLFFVALPLGYYGIGVTAWPLRLTVPGPVRVLAITIAVRVALRIVELPLIERRFWMITSAMMALAAIVWLVVRLTRAGEARLIRRIGPTAFGDTTSLLRIGRWTADALVFITAVLVVLRYFGIDATAALAGLGIGGIAVALAAQKTLENVIGGLSIILDRAVRVGDFLKVEGTFGTVEYVGLRSTRIRTLERAVLSVPNGQMAMSNIQTLSDRDMFRFDHWLRLSYETTAAQIRAIAADIRELLAHNAVVDPSSIVVRLIQFGQSSLDLQLVAYVRAPQWNDFLQVQEELLLDIMGIVERRGARITLPAQIMHMAGAAAGLGHR